MRDLILKPTFKQLIVERWGKIILLNGAVCGMLLKNKYISLLAALFVLYLILALFYHYVKLNATKWIIGVETIRREKGLLSKKIDYIELYRIIDYREEQNLLQRLLKIKTLIIFSDDPSDPRMDIDGIDIEKPIVKILRNNVEQCKKKKHVYEITNR